MMKRNKFSLSNYKLLSANMGQIVPIGLQEVLPGDTFQHSTSAFIRLAPLVTPVMHPVHVKIHHFYCPSRLLWTRSMDGEANGWESFITGGEDGDDDSIYPTITPPEGGFPKNSLADYFGIRPQTEGVPISALPFRMYAKIYNEYYRDQDLIDKLEIEYDEGEDDVTNLDLQLAAWEKDYFTSSRPWEQKGPTITIPLTGDAPVTIDRVPNAAAAEWYNDGTDVKPSVNGNAGINASGRLYRENNTVGLSMDPRGGLSGVANLSGVAAVDMNDLRAAMSLQRMAEARARFGSRFTEYLAYLGIRSSDARLQRPEYLGGGKQTIQFSEVLQTAEGDDPVGTMRGHGLGVMRSNRYRRFFEEHGFVMSLMIARPVAIYADGLHRMWLRRSKEDFWQRELEHIGQQQIFNAEVAYQHPLGLASFGFQDRYDDYRRADNTVAAEMRNLLASWHLARLFPSDPALQPALNKTFVECDPAVSRIFASSATQQMYVMARHSLQARRLLSKTGKSYIF